MKKSLFLVTIAICLLFLFGIGCDEETEDPIEAPSGLTLAGATNEADLVLTWSPSPTADIDGYNIYFDNSTTPLNSTPIDATTWTHVGPDALGEYEVVAVKDEEESSGITKSTTLYTDTCDELYDFDTPTSEGYSAWGWNWTTGVGSAYSFVVGNASYIDLYYDDDNTLTSANIYSDDFDNITGFMQLSSSYDAVGNLQTTGYDDNVAVGANQVYGIVIGKEYSDEWHYIKLRIDSYTATPYDQIGFTYGYQTVKNFCLMD